MDIEKIFTGFVGSLFLIALIGIIVYAAIAWEVYKYRDCKKVGHTTVYCLFTGGK